MSIQPGVGLSFSASSSGTTLDINQPWSSLVSVAPQNFVPDGGGEVDNDGGNNPNKFVFSKMRVICRTANTGSEPVTSCLREYNLIGMAVYPTGSKTAPTIVNADLIDDGSTFTLVPPVDTSTTKEYVFSVILNHYNIASGTLSAGVPYAALMVVGGDAYTKTTPFEFEAACDYQEFFQISRLSLLSIPSPYDPYDPELATTFWVTHADTIDTETFNPMPYKLKNYNCQRLRIATISWNSTTASWVVTQHLVGPITIPYNIFNGGTYEIKTSDTDPAWFTTPNNETEQQNWEGAYSDSTKWSGSGTNPTQSISV